VVGIRPRSFLAVDQLLRDASPGFLVDHCRRSFRLAMLTAAKHARIDAKVMLHALGRTASDHCPAVRLEAASPNARAALGRHHGQSAHRAQMVWDVAVLHRTGGSADAKSRETALGAAAIGTDLQDKQQVASTTWMTITSPASSRTRSDQHALANPYQQPQQ
jgi:hypothetical protein